MCWTVDLIKVVKRHPSIWDMSYEKFKDRQESNVAWAQIARTLKVCENKCRALWKQICKKYFNYLIATSAGNPQSKVKQYVWFSELAYMLPTMQATMGKLASRQLAKEGDVVNLSLESSSQESACDDSDDDDYSDKDGGDGFGANQTRANQLENPMIVAVYQQPPNCKIPMTAEHKEVLEGEWLFFVKSNMSDILALSKAQQRQFKRQVLEAIEEMYEKND